MLMAQGEAIGVAEATSGKFWPRMLGNNCNSTWNGDADRRPVVAKDY